MKIYNFLSKAIYLTILSLALLTVSCKDDDKTPETVDTNQIVGKWQLTSITPETAGTSIPALASLTAIVPCVYSLVFTFESNNKVTPSGCDVATQLLTTTGYLTVGQDTKWKVANNTLTLTTGSTVQALPLKQNTNDMTITVNTNTATTGPAVNALLSFKRI